MHFGTLSQVRIKISTILGSHYLDVQPSGTGRQSPHREIPTSRTTPSYEVVPALQDLSGQLQKIDSKQLAKAFDTLSATLRGSPENVRAGARRACGRSRGRSPRATTPSATCSATRTT